MDADSSINNVRISFRWRPLMDGALVDEMSQWTGDRSDSAPNFILFGIYIFLNFPFISLKSTSV
jgi:hypothetical protein